MLRVNIIILLSVILYYIHYFHLNQNKCPQDTRSYVVANVEFLIKLYIHHFYHGVIGIRKNSKIQSKILKAKALVKNHIKYMKHTKIQWCHMGVIFIPKHLIWQSIQCAHILILIMHFHNRNVYCGAVPNVHVLIFLTKRQIKNTNKQHRSLGFTFITPLDVILLMV